MKLLAWVLFVPFLLAIAGTVWLALSADWSGPDYVAVPAIVENASLEHARGMGRFRGETTRIKLNYSYSWDGFVYKGWRFSCETFGGNEIMFRLRNDELDRTLRTHIQQIKSANTAFAWVDRKQPGNACLYKDGRLASR